MRVPALVGDRKFDLRIGLQAGDQRVEVVGGERTFKLQHLHPPPDDDLVGRCVATGSQNRTIVLGRLSEHDADNAPEQRNGQERFHGEPLRLPVCTRSRQRFPFGWMHADVPMNGGAANHEPGKLSLTRLI